LRHGSSTLTTPNRVKYSPMTTPPRVGDDLRLLRRSASQDARLHGHLVAEAEAGGYATLNFTFTGTCTTADRQHLPGVGYASGRIPPQCELAALSYGATRPLSSIRSRSTSDNKVVPRPDINSSNGYKGCRISGRDPKGGFDPEVEENHTFWSQLRSQHAVDFTATIGSVAGNKMLFDAPKTQIIGVAYGDRDNLRNWDLSLAFRRNTLATTNSQSRSTKGGGHVGSSA
jgi:hypothetical protein